VALQESPPTPASSQSSQTVPTAPVRDNEGQAGPPGKASSLQLLRLGDAVSPVREQGPQTQEGEALNDDATASAFGVRDGTNAEDRVAPRSRHELVARTATDGHQWVNTTNLVWSGRGGQCGAARYARTQCRGPSF